MSTDFYRLSNYWDAACANSAAAVQLRLENLVAFIASAPGAPWTLAQSWILANDVALRITNGMSEICIASSTSSYLNVGCCFLGSLQGIHDVGFAFCPGGSFGTLDGVNNPFAKATFCSAVNAHAFIEMAMPVTHYYGGDLVWNIQTAPDKLMLIIMDSTTSSGYGPYDTLMICAEEGFETTDIVGDTDLSLHLKIPINASLSLQNINSFNPGATATLVSLAYRCVGTAADDGFHEDGDLSANTVNLDAHTAGTSGSPTLFEQRKENMRVVDVLGAGITGGVKGTINREILTVCRQDVGWIDPPGYKHLRRGICIGVDLNGKQLG